MKKFFRNWFRRHIANDPSRLSEAEIDELLDELVAAEKARHKHVFDSEIGCEAHPDLGLITIFCVCGEPQVHEMESRAAGIAVVALLCWLVF